MAIRPFPSFRFQQLNRAYQSDPRRILGQQLNQAGVSAAPVATPLQGLGRLAQALVGAKLQRDAIDAQVTREDDLRKNIGTALSGIDLSKTPGLSAYSNLFPELALPLAANLDIKRATTKPTETFTTLTNQQAQNQGLPVDRGQVYQIGSVSKQIKPIGSTTSSSMGSRAAQLTRIIQLSNLSNLSNEQKQEFDGLKALISREQRINRVNPQTGDSESIVIPGLNIESILIGNESKVTEKDDKPIITKTAKLSEKEAGFVSDAASASNDIKTIIDIMFGGDLQGGQYNKGVAILSGSSIGRAGSGDAQKLYNAIQNLVDLRLRSRTGATANQQEIDLYLSQVVPGVATRDSTVRANIERLRIELGTNIDAFRQGRNIKNLPNINVNDYLKKDDEKTNSNLINLPEG